MSLYTYLGRTGLEVSRLCLGTMNFGGYTEKADAFAIMDAALDNGINYFDTANSYGRSVKFGLTEEIIGEWFAQGGGRREKVVIGTKVNSAQSDWVNDGNLTARHIRHAIEGSLRRLQTDHVDIYQMHHVDRNTPFEEILQAMDRLIQEGKVIYLGSSNFAGWHIAKFNELAKQRHMLGLVVEQCLYNITGRYAEMEVLPVCEDYGMGVITYSPLIYGHLAGKTDSPRSKRLEAVRWPTRFGEPAHDRLAQYLAYCEEIGLSPARVALAWLLHNPVITAPIIGPRTLDQLMDSLPALELKLDDYMLAKLDEIWPGIGPSPEAFAW